MPPDTIGLVVGVVLTFLCGVVVGGIFAADYYAKGGK